MMRVRDIERWSWPWEMWSPVANSNSGNSSSVLCFLRKKSWANSTWWMMMMKMGLFKTM